MGEASGQKRLGRLELSRKLLFVAVSVAASGCVAIPVESGSSGSCPRRGRASVPCQRHLVVGLFPAVGEAHLNHLATNGKPLTTGLRIADYSLRPLYTAAFNALSLGFMTVSSWLLEPYEDYGPDHGSCEMALLGYCKAGKMLPHPLPAIPDDPGDRT